MDATISKTHTKTCNYNFVIFEIHHPRAVPRAAVARVVDGVQLLRLPESWLVEFPGRFVWRSAAWARASHGAAEALAPGPGRKVGVNVRGVVACHKRV